MSRGASFKSCSRDISDAFIGVGVSFDGTTATTVRASHAEFGLFFAGESTADKPLPVLLVDVREVDAWR